MVRALLHFLGLLAGDHVGHDRVHGLVDDGQDVGLEGLGLLGSLGLHGMGVGLGGGVRKLVFQVLAGDVVLGVGAFDLFLNGLLGALLVALDLFDREPVLLLELLALSTGL